MTLGSTHPLTEMSTRNVFCGGGGGAGVKKTGALTILPVSCADCLAVWGRQPPETLSVSTGIAFSCVFLHGAQRDNFRRYLYRTNNFPPFLRLLQGGSNMTGTDLCVDKPNCAAAVRPWESEATTSTLPPARVRTCLVLSGSC